MYIPPAFNDSNPDEVRSFIRDNSFGILINLVKGKIWASHIPLLMAKDENEEDILLGHISKGNRQWKGFDDNEEVLAIFQGPHTYVSSTWYNHHNVPTWNYAAVHVYGKLSILNTIQLKNSLEDLMDKYEGETNTHLKMKNLPEKLISRELKGIVGFQIKITDVQAAFKMSQNRDTDSYDNVVNELSKSELYGSKEVAEIMKKRRIEEDQ